MSLAGKLLSAAGTARTFALNFWPWLLGAFLLGAATSIWPTFKVTQAFYQRATLQAQLNLSEFTGQLAANAVQAEQQVSDLLAQRASEQAERDRAAAERDAAISAAVAAIPSRVARQLQPDLLAFRSALNADPNLACLDLPLPAGALGVLQRPGGQARPDAAPNR